MASFLNSLEHYREGYISLYNNNMPVDAAWCIHCHEAISSQSDPRHIRVRQMNQLDLCERMNCILPTQILCRSFTILRRCVPSNNGHIILSFHKYFKTRMSSNYNVLTILCVPPSNRAVRPPSQPRTITHLQNIFTNVATDFLSSSF